MIPLTDDDVQAALERELTSDETEKLDSRVQKASDLVEGYLGIVYGESDTVPGVVTRVSAAAVARLYQRDQSKGVPLFQDTRTSGMGPFNSTIRYSPDVTSGDPWLTKADKTRLKSVFSGFRAAGVASDRGC